MLRARLYQPYSLDEGWGAGLGAFGAARSPLAIVATPWTYLPAAQARTISAVVSHVPVVGRPIARALTSFASFLSGRRRSNPPIVTSKGRILWEASGKMVDIGNFYKLAASLGVPAEVITEAKRLWGTGDRAGCASLVNGVYAYIKGGGVWPPPVDVVATPVATSAVPAAAAAAVAAPAPYAYAPSTTTGAAPSSGLLPSLAPAPEAAVFTDAQGNVLAPTMDRLATQPAASAAAGGIPWALIAIGAGLYFLTKKKGRK